MGEKQREVMLFILMETTTPATKDQTSQSVIAAMIINTNSFCEECGNPRPTPTTTTTKPSRKLKCYSCTNCDEVDENTPTAKDPEFNSCFTKIYPNMMIVRGGTSEIHIDGECSDEDGIVTCWCDDNLCNTN